MPDMGLMFCSLQDSFRILNPSVRDLTLAESGFSYVDDLSVYSEIEQCTRGSKDAAPAWIGSYLPMTRVDVFSDICRWNQFHYWWYLVFVQDFMPHRGRVLDLGCGSGHRSRMLARYSREVVGIDKDAIPVAFARKHNASSVVRYVCDSFPCDLGEPFDYIFCIEVIEHLPYEKQNEFIESCLKSLRTGGLLFVTTPHEWTVASPHIGTITPDMICSFAERWRDNIVYFDFLNNTSDAKISRFNVFNPRTTDYRKGSHYRLVFRA